MNLFRYTIIFQPILNFLEGQFTGSNGKYKIGQDLVSYRIDKLIAIKVEKNNTGV